ncbi:unnamed protein product [Eruca vesicaria subsp. sativa]|uniref:Protein kinase domain-containing protein n=1 Tax=Eruca vesicaria subsp. sativa TaxID=29727 RepID=A0ABC8K2Q4_ERUVS|nr:unnamed protein product [Eruca vesicaria subsp. sativa]
MSGNIGPMTSSGSIIRLLDLSHNRFDGDLPSEFGSLTKLQVLNLAANNLSGSLPSSMDDMVSLSSLDVSQNHFTGPLPSNLSTSLVSFNVSYNDLSGTVPENLKNFPPPSFYPGNSMLIMPPGSTSASEVSKGKPMNLLIKVVIIVSCGIALIILILVAILLFCICKSRRRDERSITGKDINMRDQTVPSGSGGGTVISAEDLVTSKKGSSSGILSPDEKLAVATTGFSPSKTSNLSWSPGSGDSLPADQQLARLDVRSPDRLVGELQFLDESIKLTPEELSRAPAEVLGRSSHGTSYRATLDNGVFLTVKWLREGVAKQRKEFAKEVKKFANIRHPNVVTLRGYYWGPTQHEKLILSDYISPGSLLASFTIDQAGKALL